MISWAWPRFNLFCHVTAECNTLPFTAQNTRLQHEESHWRHRTEHTKAVFVTAGKNYICITSHGASITKTDPFPDTHLKMLKYKLLSGTAAVIRLNVLERIKMWIICLTGIPHWYKRLLKLKLECWKAFLFFPRQKLLDDHEKNAVNLSGFMIDITSKFLRK